jgi:hypothetical protein
MHVSFQRSERLCTKCCICVFLPLFYDFPIEFSNFADSVVFFNTYVRHTAWVDTYPGGLLVHEGIILPVSISPHDDHRSSGYRPVKTLFGAVHFSGFI